MAQISHSEGSTISVSAFEVITIKILTELLTLSALKKFFHISLQKNTLLYKTFVETKKCYMTFQNVTLSHNFDDIIIKF